MRSPQRPLAGQRSPCAPSEPPDPRVALLALPDDAPVTEADVALVMRCSAKTIKRMIEAGKFPAGFTVGNRQRWLMGTVRGWLREVSA